MVEKLYYKILDDKTKEVLVAIGDDVEWFKSMGYSQQGNIEKDYNGKYYLEGFAPQNLDELKKHKNEQVKEAYLTYRNFEATVPSVLGFTADANTRAWTDVMGLVTKAQSAPDGEKITFRAADNTFHEITREQLGTLLLEIIATGEDSYAQKWAMNKAIEAATTKAELDAIDTTFKSPTSPITV